MSKNKNSSNPEDWAARKYQARKSDCTGCALKAKCGPNSEARAVYREKYEIVRQCAASEFNPKAQARRKKVEMLFAHLKRILGLGRLRLRGPCGVQDEFTLAAAAQNLRKLAKLKPMVQATAQIGLENTICGTNPTIANNLRAAGQR